MSRSLRLRVSAIAETASVVPNLQRIEPQRTPRARRKAGIATRGTEDSGSRIRRLRSSVCSLLCPPTQETRRTQNKGLFGVPLFDPCSPRVSIPRAAISSPEGVSAEAMSRSLCLRVSAIAETASAVPNLQRIEPQRTPRARRKAGMATRGTEGSGIRTVGPSLPVYALPSPFAACRGSIRPRSTIAVARGGAVVLADRLS